MKRYSVKVETSGLAVKKLARLRVVVASALLVGFGGCTATRRPLTTDKTTSWLITCEVTSECGRGLSCIHGICTTSCSTSDACAELAQDAICATPRTNLCSPRAEPTSGFCTLGCGERACAGAAARLTCVESACVSRSCAGDAGIPATTPVDSGGQNASPPCSRGWGAVTAMKQARFQHTATLLQNGKVLVVGGANASGIIPDAELYDPATGNWTNAGTLNDARYGHEAVLLANGTVLVVGGATGGIAGGMITPLGSAELYDPIKNSWTLTRALMSERAGTATLLNSGMVLYAAGQEKSGASGLGSWSARSEIYDPLAGLWSITGDLNQKRGGHTATLLQDGEVLVAGGTSTGNEALTSAETYDPSTGLWTTVGSLHEGRQGFRATLLQNGKVLVAGGSFPPTTPSGSADLYDPPSKSWSQAASMTDPRWNHTATLLPDGKVLVAGGSAGVSGNTFNVVTTAEVYDASANTWSPAGILVQPRWGHAATLLEDGSVLIEGGYADANTTQGAELYACH